MDTSDTEGDIHIALGKPIETNQCPVCLKTLSNKAYVQRHLFDTKKGCTPPAGHIPPIIDQVNRTITWSQSTPSPVSVSVSSPPLPPAPVSAPISASADAPTEETKVKKLKRKKRAVAMEEATLSPLPVLADKSKEIDLREQELKAREAELLAREARLRNLEQSLVAREHQVPISRPLPTADVAPTPVSAPAPKPIKKKVKGASTALVPVKPARETPVSPPVPQIMRADPSAPSGAAGMAYTMSSNANSNSSQDGESDYLPAVLGNSHHLHTVNVKPKVEIQRSVATNTQGSTRTIETTNTITNNYTIAVDTNGNVVDLPHMRTDNDILKDNPALMDQVRQVIKNLNLGNKTGEPNYRLPPEIEKFQKSVDRALDEFGDVQKIIRSGLKYPMENVDAIVSINPDETECIQIEKIPIPEFYRVPAERDLSFVEIIYRGIYHLISQVVAHKFYFFENTRSKKAYDDCNRLMKYRKLVQTSYIVLKNRLDKIADPNQKYPELTQKLVTNHETYYKKMNGLHTPNANQYDNTLFVKFQTTAKLTPLELQSLTCFYENLSQLMLLYRDRTIINPVCPILVEEDHSKHVESEVKRRPDYRYVKLENLSAEHKNFPDYDFEIVSRDFCSHLIKVKTTCFPREQSCRVVPYYYKRIYVDGTCEAPLTESEYEIFKEIY